MIRLLLCRQCGEQAELYDEDIASGFHQRKLYLSAKKPEHHGISVNGVFSPCDLICDRCSEPLAGKVSVAVTTWRGPEPRHWESDYGEILPAQAVAVIDTLTKK